MKLCGVQHDLKSKNMVSLHCRTVKVGSINSKMMKTYIPAIILSAFSFFLASFSDSLDCIARYAHSLFKEICSKIIQKSSQYNL